VNHRIVAALVVALLAVSCTPGQPDQIESKLRAQRPVEKISTNFEFYCLPSPNSCPVSMAVRHRRETEALVGQLRQDKPSWLRYVKAVEIGSTITSYGPHDVGRLSGDGEVHVQTGIFVNEAGRDLGAEICLAMLKEEFNAASIYGVLEDSVALYRAGLVHTQVPLAQCPSMMPLESSRH
jgi:hypothetical protein